MASGTWLSQTCLCSNWKGPGKQTVGHVAGDPGSHRSGRASKGCAALRPEPAILAAG